MVWLMAFQRDPSYGRLRPLYEISSPWRKDIHTYLIGQSRRLGSRRQLQYHFLKLSWVASSYLHLHAFFLSPFSDHNFNQVFLELTHFLQYRFINFTDPWQGYLGEQPKLVLDYDRQKLLKQILARPKVAGSDISFVIENAIREVPELLSSKSNEDLFEQLFSTPISAMTIEVGDYTVVELPVVLGSHYISKKTYKNRFNKKKFYRILGSYVRWDDAKVVIFRKDKNHHQMFLVLKDTMKLVNIGTWKHLEVDGVDYYLSLLVDFDLPEKSFYVSEWELNCPSISIEKDTTNYDND
jgi:hypothetical protein